jgi:hypothetical protein
MSRLANPGLLDRYGSKSTRAILFQDAARLERDDFLRIVIPLDFFIGGA